MARSRVLVWVGRLLVVAGVIYGMWHDSVCGPAFFPDGGMDYLTQELCASSLADRRGTAILLMFFGFAAMGVGQVMAVRAERAAEKDAG